MSTNKSFSTETSERYARALFEISLESNELEKVETDLKNFQSLLTSSIDVRNFIQDPTLTNIQQNEVLNLLASKLNFSKNLKNFFLLLIEKRRIFFIQRISESFLKLCLRKRNEIQATLISSKKLSQSELDSISKDLSTSMNSNLKFKFKIEEDLIGGFKLQLGSIMIDTSIKNKLKKYQQTMLES